MSADKKLTEIIARAIADADNWQDFIEDAQRTLAAIRAGYLLIPTEGPKWDAWVQRVLGHPRVGAYVTPSSLDEALRAAGRVKP